MTHQDFIDEVLEIANAAVASGAAIHAGIAAAQAAQETGFGASEACTEGNNLFGIKASSSWRGQTIAIRSVTYRRYPSREACISDYANVIANRIWFADAAAAARRGDGRGFLKGLVNTDEPRWAEDTKYESKVLSIANQYKLLDDTAPPRPVLGFTHSVNRVSSLRRRPARDGEFIALLGTGDLVHRISDQGNWSEVAMLSLGSRIAGFVVSAALDPLPEEEADSNQTRSPPVDNEDPDTVDPNQGSNIPAVHTKEGRAEVTRAAKDMGAHPLGETGRPIWTGGSASQRAAHLPRIIEWLDVDNAKHGRYAATSKATFCNIYAYDYCYLAGVYLPRVWWTKASLQRLAKGEEPEVKYGQTVEELRANELYDWLTKYGERFGWKPLDGLDEMQNAANRGDVVIICGQKRNRNTSGHISVVAPEKGSGHTAKRDQRGRVLTPLQSQAGSNNFKYGGTVWWEQQSFGAHGFWHNPTT